MSCLEVRAKRSRWIGATALSRGRARRQNYHQTARTRKRGVLVACEASQPPRTLRAGAMRRKECPMRQAWPLPGSSEPMQHAPRGAERRGFRRSRAASGSERPRDLDSGLVALLSRPPIPQCWRSPRSPCGARARRFPRGEPSSLRLTSIRALLMSQFWQNFQPRLHPAVSNDSTAVPGKKRLSGFFSTDRRRSPPTSRSRDSVGVRGRSCG